MRTLLIGGNGQLGEALRRRLGPKEALVITTRSGVLSDGASCELLDLAELHAIEPLIERIAPDVVVNAAAYTSVDRMGNPAIATALIGTSQKNIYNDVTPTQDAAGQFITEERNLLNGLYSNIADDLVNIGLRLCGRPA